MSATKSWVDKRIRQRLLLLIPLCWWFEGPAWRSATNACVCFCLSAALMENWVGALRKGPLDVLVDAVTSVQMLSSGEGPKEPFGLCGEDNLL